MAENKTQPTLKSVVEFIHAIENQQRKADAFALLDIFAQQTNEQGVLWGNNIVGYGTYSYQTADKKTHRSMRTGFSPRKQNMALYIMLGVSQFEEKLQSLGKFKSGKACFYFTKLSEVDEQVLGELIKISYEEMARRYPL